MLATYLAFDEVLVDIELISLDHTSTMSYFFTLLTTPLSLFPLQHFLFLTFFPLASSLFFLMSFSVLFSFGSCLTYKSLSPHIRKPAASINNSLCVEWEKDGVRKRVRGNISKCSPWQWACVSLCLFVNPSSQSACTHSHTMNMGVCVYMCVLRCPWPKLRDEARWTVSAMKINAMVLHTVGSAFYCWLKSHSMGSEKHVLRIQRSQNNTGHIWLSCDISSLVNINATVSIHSPKLFSLC